MAARPATSDSSMNTEQLSEAAGGTGEDITLYFINMVVISASDLPTNADSALLDKSDPYCEITIDGSVTDKTTVAQNNFDPVWNKQMTFFFTKKPDKMEVRVWDEDTDTTNNNDDFLGMTEFAFGDMFERSAEFEGDLNLTNKTNQQQGGSVQIKMRCHLMNPIETERKLVSVQNELVCKEDEHKAVVAALDESERLGGEVMSQLTEKERENIQLSEELAEQHRLHVEELSKKEKELHDQSQTLEGKEQEIEKARVAMRDTEMEKKEIEVKLTEAEKENLSKVEELKTIQRQNTQNTETLKKEHENELTTKTKEYDDLTKETNKKLSNKEKELLDKEDKLVTLRREKSKLEQTVKKLQIELEKTNAEMMERSGSVCAPFFLSRSSKSKKTLGGGNK